MSRRRKYTDSQGRRLRRPQSWMLIPAVLMAVFTTITAAIGISTYFKAQSTSEPQYEVKIVVEGKQEWNISQATVDAAMEEPILSHQPLTLTVTDRFLSGDEVLRGILPNNDIVLSTQLENKKPADSKAEYRFNGVAIRSDLAQGRDRRAYEEDFDVSFEIDNAFRDNLGLGHGPKAVVAAAQRAAIVLYDPPNTNPVFWISLIGLGASATAVFLLISVRYSLRWEAKHRRLTAAQRKLARVVLDLEALETTYYAAAAKDRPDGFKASWTQLQHLSLELARSEDPLVASIFSRSECFSEQTSQKLADFEAASRRLTSLSDALMGAGSVHARLAGTSSTFDRLSSPVNDALNRLLIRLERAPGKMVANCDIDALRTALGRLLDAASGDAKNRQTIAAWQDAERQIVELTGKLKKQLSRYPHGKIPVLEPAAQDYLELKKSLGLDVSLAKDGYTNAANLDALVRSITGETLESDKQAPQKKSVHRKIDALYRPRGVRLVVGLAAVLLVGMIPAAILAAQLTSEPFVEREGTGLGANLEVDDPSGALSNTEIIRYVASDFPVPTNMVVAVRDAEAYLKLQTQKDSDYRTADPRSILTSMHRIKQEFPALLDPATKELNSGKAIIPIFYTDQGTAIVPGLISPEVSAGKYTLGGSSTWQYGNIFESKHPEITIANAVDDYAKGLERNGFEEDTSVSFGQLFWLFTWLFFFTVLNIVLGIRFLLTASGSLGRFGRGTAELRKASAKIEKLLMGLDDSQINAVAVLGASSNGKSDDAGQRLFERALAMALREERELEATPAIERLRRGFSARVAHLDHLANVLADRDADVARRAQALINATRGAGGDAPKNAALPGT